MKKSVVFSLILILFLTPMTLINLIRPTMAYYNFDGYELTWMVYGKIHGDLYVSGGHGVDSTPYVETFSIPNGDDIIWAQILVGVWGGNEFNTGWVDTQINGTSLGTLSLGGVNDKNTNVLASAHGVYMVFYIVTSYLELNKTFEVTVNSGGAIDGRIYGIVLFVLFNKTGNNPIKFCMGMGNMALHYLIQGNTQDYSTFTFKDTYTPSQHENATLYVSQLATASGENDYLYFNDNLLDSNAGDESSGSYFDLDEYNITNYLAESNTLKFNRGGESYIHPILSILKATYITGQGEDADYVFFNTINGNSPFEEQINWTQIIITIEVIVIISITAGFFYYQYRRKRITKKDQG